MANSDEVKEVRPSKLAKQLRADFDHLSQPVNGSYQWGNASAILQAALAAGLYNKLNEGKWIENP